VLQVSVVVRLKNISTGKGILRFRKIGFLPLLLVSESRCY